MIARSLAALLPVADDHVADFDDAEQLGCSIRRQVHAAVASVPVRIHRTAERRLPSGVMQADAVAFECHPVRNRLLLSILQMHQPSGRCLH